MIKLLMSPQKYNLGVSLNDSHLSNIKMLCTSLYYGGIRSFAMSAVPLKDLSFQNDQDGGVQRVLFDQQKVNMALGMNAVKVNT